MIRSCICLLLVIGTSITTLAHEPNRKCQPVRQRVDLIPPIGNDHPPEYRRQYNRPRDFVGRIAYIIAPSSQEAMAWHRAKHRCYYENNVGYREQQYFYAKPWEALRVGPRLSKKDQAKAAEAKAKAEMKAEMKKETPKLNSATNEKAKDPTPEILDAMDLEPIKK